MTTDNEVTIKAWWVFDNDDTWHLLANGRCLAEIQYSKYFGGGFYAIVGKSTALNTTDQKHKQGKKLERLMRWCEKMLGATRKAAK